MWLYGEHTFVILIKGCKFITKIGKDVTLLKEGRDMSILRVSKAVRLLLEFGTWRY